MCGRTGVNGAVTSAVVTELVRETERAQTLHPQMAVTIVKGRHKKRQIVYWYIVQVKFSCIVWFSCYTNGYVTSKGGRMAI